MNDLTQPPGGEYVPSECKCVSCADCRGTGNIRVDQRGRYIDYYDDCYDLEACPSCHGGIIEQCDRCAELDEIEQAEEFERDRKATAK